MTRIIIVLFAIGFIFSNTQFAFADEGHEHSQNVGEATDVFRNGSDSSQVESEEHSDSHQEGKGVDHSNMDGDEHSTMDMEDEDSHSDNHSSTESGHNDDEAAHSEEATEGHHGPVVETPPNYKVLGSFGAVNLSFVLIGIWNKWIRTKGV